MGVVTACAIAARRGGWLLLSMLVHALTEIRRSKLSFCVGATSVLIVVRFNNVEIWSRCKPVTTVGDASVF